MRCLRAPSGSGRCTESCRDSVLDSRSRISRQRFTNPSSVPRSPPSITCSISFDVRLEYPTVSPRTSCRKARGLASPCFARTAAATARPRDACSSCTVESVFVAMSLSPLSTPMAYLPSRSRTTPITGLNPSSSRSGLDNAFPTPGRQRRQRHWRLYRDNPLRAHEDRHPGIRVSRRPR